MSTQLKNVTFGDSVLKEDASGSVGAVTCDSLSAYNDVSASNVSANTISASVQVSTDTIEASYIVINGTKYSMSVNSYGFLVLAQV